MAWHIAATSRSFRHCCRNSFTKYAVCCGLTWLTFFLVFLGLTSAAQGEEHGWVQYVSGGCALTFWASTILQLVHWNANRNIGKTTGLLAISISAISSVAYTFMTVKVSWVVSVLGPRVEPARLAQWLSCVFLHGVLFAEPALPDSSQGYLLPCTLTASVLCLLFSMTTSSKLVAWFFLGFGSILFLHFPFHIIQFLFKYKRSMLTGQVESFVQVHRLLLMTVVFSGWTFYVIIFFISLELEVSGAALSLLLSSVDMLSKHVFSWLHCLFSLETIRNRGKLDEILIRDRQEYWQSFVQYICHEIRNPLNASSLALELIGEDHPELDHLPAALNGVQMAINSMDNSLLMQRINSDHWTTIMRSFDVREAVAGLVRMYAPTAKWKSVEIRATYESFNRTSVLGDPSLFLVIIRNVLAHGISNTKPGSVVCLVVSIEPSNAAPDYVSVKVAVRDRSDGMPPDFDAHINMPNTELRDCTAGEYLGLYISGTLARRVFSGSLSIENVPATEGEGASYTFEADLKCSPNPGYSLDCSQAEEVIQLDHTILEKLHVMVVDDVIMNRVCMIQKLKRHGITRISTAEDGIDAMEQLQKMAWEDSTKVHLLLLDDYMPNMTGREVVAKIRTAAELKDIPVIGVTGNALQSDQELFRAAGLDELYIKPISGSDIVRSLALACLKYREMNEVEGTSPLVGPSDPDLNFPEPLSSLEVGLW